MLYDAHVHFVPQKIAQYTSFYHGVWQDKYALSDFLDAAGIAQALLVYPTTDAHKKLRGHEEVAQIYNAEVEALALENSKIIPAALLNMDDVSYIPMQIDELADRGFKVVNLASSYHGRFVIDKLSLVFEALERQRMKVFIHPQTDDPIGFERVNDPLLMPVLEYSFDLSMCMGLLMMGGVFERYPHVQFIFSSLGGVMPFMKDRFDRVYPMLKSRGMVKDLGKMPSEVLKNVCVDTSGANLANLKLALELFGEDNILWGSDYPVNPDVKENMESLESLGLSIKTKITAKNFQRLFDS